MANAVVAAIADHGMTGTVVARNAATGQSLASRYGWSYSDAVPAGDLGLVVNVTPLGMAGADADVRSFSDAEIQRAQVVFDVVAFPVETPLIRAATRLGVPVITGGEVISRQAAAQFELYTGVRPTPEDVAAAEEYASA